MFRTTCLFVCLIGVALIGAPALSQDLFIYPEKGQSPDQQQKDELDCYTWAKGRTGFDPMAAPTASTSAPLGQEQSVAGGAAKGGLLGAATGALIGGVTGKSATKGAKAGAVGGGVIGGVSRHQSNSQLEAERQQWAQREANRYAEQRNAYNRAYAACLEGRGYTVR